MKQNVSHLPTYGLLGPLDNMVNPSRSTLPLPSNVLHFPSHPARKCPARIANDQKKYAYIMFLSFMVVKNINMCPGAVFWL